MLSKVYFYVVISLGLLQGLPAAGAAPIDLSASLSARSEKWEPVFGKIERKNKKIERASRGKLKSSRSGCGANSAAVNCQRAALPESGIMLIRDTRASAAGGGGNGGENTCWSSCFHNYNECMDTGPKNMCVTRMKSCLELCDRLSNKPRM